MIQQRAIDPAIQEVVPPEDDVRTFRMSNTVLGNGYVEVIPDEEILRIRNEQRKWGMEGFAVVVPVPVEAKKGADGKTEFTFVERIGRFGWKCQEASLLNFSARRLRHRDGHHQPDAARRAHVQRPGRVEVRHGASRPRGQGRRRGRSEEAEHLFGNDVEAFTRFMRSTKASPRDPDARRHAGRGRGRGAVPEQRSSSAAPSATSPTTPRRRRARRS